MQGPAERGVVAAAAAVAVVVVVAAAEGCLVLLESSEGLTWGCDLLVDSKLQHKVYICTHLTHDIVCWKGSTTKTMLFSELFLH